MDLWAEGVLVLRAWKPGHMMDMIVFWKFFRISVSRFVAFNQGIVSVFESITTIIVHVLANCGPAICRAVHPSYQTGQRSPTIFYTTMTIFSSTIIHMATLNYSLSRSKHEGRPGDSRESSTRSSRSCNAYVPAVSASYDEGAA